MYCKNCGKFLLENDKFCSNCGARVVQQKQNPGLSGQAGQDNTPVSGGDIPKPTPPVDNIQWNISDFPGHDVKKTEEINFDWGNTSIFKKPETPEDEIALNPVQKPEEGKPTEGGFVAVETVVEEIIRGKDLEEEIFAEASLVESIPAGGEPHKRNKIVDKFYTFNKKNEEFQKLLDKEYEKIKAGESDSLDEQYFRSKVSEINSASGEPWPEFNPTEHIAEMAMARDRFFGPMEDPYKPPVSPEPPVAAEPAAEPATIPEAAEPPEAADAAVAVEPNQAEEAAAETEPAEETMPEETAEATNLPGEEPLPEKSILPDLEICNEEQTMKHHKPDEDAAPVFTTPLDNHVIPEDFDEPKPEAAIAEATSPADSKPDDDVNSIRDKWIKYEEDEDEEEEGRSGGKVGKFIIGFLLLLLLTQVALLGIKLVAPESAVAQFVDDKVQQVIQFFQGENNNSQALVIDRNIAADDKTGLIQMQIDKNHNGNIAVIKYNAELRLDTVKQYSDEALNQSTVLEENKWYTKEEGGAVYYDDSAIGAAIAYESNKRLEDGEAFATLEIGEIRISGETLYVWVAEEITPGGRVEKILRITVSGETMSVTTEYDV